MNKFLNYLLFLSISLCFLPFSTAQIEEQSRVMSMGSKNAAVGQLDEASKKFTEDFYKSFMRDYGKRTKKDRKTNEWVTEEARIVSIGGANDMTVYMKSEEYAEGTEVALWIDMGGAFVNSEEYPDQFNETVLFLENMLHQARVEFIEEELKAEEKLLKKVESDLETLRKNNKKYHTDIEKARDLIAKREAEIIQNEADQEKSMNEIAIQKDKVTEVKDKLETARNDL